MQYVDRHTNSARIDDSVEPLLRAMLDNQQIRYGGQDDLTKVTKAIKYERERQPRRDTSEYKGGDDFVKSIISIFKDIYGTDFAPLDFQVNSWQTVRELNQERQEQNQTKAGIFSAPTGFGKTEAFLGPLYQLLREGQQESVAIVYPSRALLADQLERILEHIYSIKNKQGDQLSVGCYIGNMPWELEEVGKKGLFESSSNGRSRFTLCNCWCGDEEPHSFKLHRTKKSYMLKCENNSDHQFTDSEVLLSRKNLVFDEQPDILLTTLTSLENFAHKAHYPLIDLIDTIVLDEVHLKTGLEGAHAANVIENVNKISDDPLLWLGSSATIDNPDRFGREIFGVSSNDIETTNPPESDYDDSHDDYEHYYFMLAPEEGPGVTSMAIQQSMLLGHTMLENKSGHRSKQLSFIDSISQVNQQKVQFSDADKTDELWQFHRDGEFDENWDRVAAGMGQQFVDEPLNVMPVYSDRGFDKEEAINSDVFLSTNFLEVGIDVGEIKIITQHRTPWNLSSFKQRAGRAAREPGMDSHIAIYLSSLTGDANMFYRADRFLQSDIRTPLNTDNPVVDWMHDKFNRYYNHIVEINDESFTSDLDKHMAFLERYLKDDIGFDEYHEMLMNPKSFFSERLGVEVPADRLLSEQVVDKVSERLDNLREEKQKQVQDIEQHFDMEDGNIIRGENAIDSYILEVKEETEWVIRSFIGQCSGFASKIENETGETNADNGLEETLRSVQSRARDVPDGDNTAKVNHFSKVLADLYGPAGQLMHLQSRANDNSEEPLPQVKQDRLEKLKDTVYQLEVLSEDGRLQEYYRLETQTHYLQTALDEYKSYLSYATPYNTLYGIKDLLRGAYYFDLYLQTEGEQLDDEVWFVPPDYFGSSGQFVKVFREGTQEDRPEESIDQIVNTFAPYRSEYQSESGAMNLLAPKTEITEDGIRMDYTKHVTGEERKGVLVPDTMQLTEVRDLSGDSANKIVQYCPQCYEIISDETMGECFEHGESEYAKIHSKPHVKTTVTDRDKIESTGDLILADLNAIVALDSVTLEFTPGKDYGSKIGVEFDSDAERFTKELQSPKKPLGYTTRTRGLVYNIEPFVEGLDEEVKQMVGRYKDFDEFSLEYIVYHTAAHFFLQLVTDISSVSNQSVFYGFNQEEGEVYVFERTEGGQGIVDLVYNELQSDPGSVLQSMNRLMFNEQVINERLWAHSEFVDRLPVENTGKEHIQPLVGDILETPFDNVIDRVTEEVISTIDRTHQFATDEGISKRESYNIKHVIAASQIAGDDGLPVEKLESLEAEFSDIDRVETAFYSPDIDGCVQNLHITECIGAGDQSQTLSYIILEVLRDHLREAIPATEAAEQMFERELPPGGEINGTSIFLDF